MIARIAVRRTLAAATAAALAGGLVATATTPALATVNGMFAVTAPEDIFTPVSGRLPAAESALQWGAALGADPANRIAVLGLAAGNTGALVRVSLAAAEEDRQIFTGTAEQPSVLLTVPAGQAASTTTLLSVVDGTVALWSSVSSDARIEVIAGLDGKAGMVDQGTGQLLSASTPGSTVTLDAPLTRADSANGLGGYGIAPGRPMEIGLTGEGTIPSKHVRAVYAAVTLDLDQAATVTLDGIDMPLPAGVTSFTSVLSPDDLGLVRAEIDGGSASLRLDVLGWIPDGDENHDRVNVTGGFEVASGEIRQQELTATVGTAPSELPISEAGEGAYVMVLVQADQTAGSGMLDFGAAESGRATGVVVDSAAGALPQLMVVPAEEVRQLHMSRGGAEASVHVLGEYLGEAQRSEADVVIDSHSNGETVDLRKRGFFELAGSLESEPGAVDHVEVAIEAVDAPGFDPADYHGEIGQDGYFGNAKVFVDESGAQRFEAMVGAPIDGRYRYTVTLVNRAGEKFSTEVELKVKAVVESSTTVSPDALVVNGDGDPQMGATDNARVVTFAELPEGLDLDTVLVSHASGEFPDGFLGRVEQIERIGETWQVRTVEAALTEVILNSDIDEVFEFDADNVGEPESLAPLAGEAGDDPLELTITDSETGETLTRDDVDYRNERVSTGELVTGEAAAFEDNAEQQLQSEGSWDKQAALEVNPVFYLIVGEGSGKSNVIVHTMTNASKQQTDTIFTRIADHPVDGIFEAMIRAEVKAKADVHVVLDIKVTKKLKYIPVGITVNNFTVDAQVSTKLGVEIAANGSAERTLELAEPLKRTEVGSFTIYVGPIPVIVKNYVSLSINAEAKIRADVLVKNMSYEQSMSRGFRYSSAAGVRELSSESTRKFTAPTVSGLKGKTAAELEGSLSVGPTLKVETLIYGIAGPELVVMPRANISGLLEAEGSPETGYQIAAEARAWLSIKGSFSGKLRIYKWDIINFAEVSRTWEQEIWSDKWAWEIMPKNKDDEGNPPNGESGASDASDVSGAPDGSDAGEASNADGGAGALTEFALAS